MAHVPDEFGIFVARADVARDGRKWKEAAELYEKALILRPEASAIWVQLGNMAKEAGDYGRSEFAYKKALDLSPNEYDTHLQLGHLFKVRKDMGAARASYARALELNPESKDAAEELSLIDVLVAENSPPSWPDAKPSPEKQLIRSLNKRPNLNGKFSTFREQLEEILHLEVTGKLEIEQGELLLEAPAIQRAIDTLQALLEKSNFIIREGGANNNKADVSPQTKLEIVFDVSDLIQYFRHHRLPTGIQRVQMQVISAAVLNPKDNLRIRISCFTESQDYWREIPIDLFLTICRSSLSDGDWTKPDWRALMGELDDGMNVVEDFTFASGAYLVNLGTSWWLQNYFLHIREAKRRSNIHYVPFVHDMIPIMTPEFCVEGLVQDFISWAQGVFLHADFFFVNSKSTKRDLIKVGRRLGFELEEGLVHTARLDADYRKSNIVKEPPTRVLNLHRLATEKYVLFVSTIEARKNHGAIFDAWLHLCKELGDEAVPRLVCVGSRGWLNDSVFAKLNASKRLRDKVVMLSGVKDADLATLYENCLISIYPSFYEGWGLPVTETLCHGKTALVANSSSLPEAGGSFVDYFELGNEESLFKQLKKLLFDPVYRAERESFIGAQYRPRSWKDLSIEILETVGQWDAAPAERREDIRTIEIGRYYSFARNSDLTIYSGMRSGEIFRTGNGWWGPNEWGCWLKPGPAQLAFRTAIGLSSLRIYLGLRAPKGPIVDFDVTVQFRVKIEGKINPEETKWVVCEIDASTPDEEILIVLEGYGRRLEKPREDHVPVPISIGVVGLFVCREDDQISRNRFAEAVALDTLAEFSRGQRYRTISAEGDLARQLPVVAAR